MAKEDFFLIIAISHATELVGITPLSHHRTSELGGLLNIRGSTRSDVFLAELQLFSHAATHHDRQTRNHPRIGRRITITLWQLHHHTQRTTTRNDGCLMDWVRTRHIHRYDGMSGFVISRVGLFFRRHGRAAFRTHHDLVLSVLKLLHGHKALVTTRCHQSRFVHEVGKVCTREARCAACNDLEIDIRCKRNIAHMHFQDLFATNDIRVRNHDLTVETTWTKKRWIKNVGTVCCSNQND